jgi:hypothetical protein
MPTATDSAKANGAAFGTTGSPFAVAGNGRSSGKASTNMAASAMKAHNTMNAVITIDQPPGFPGHQRPQPACG